MPSLDPNCIIKRRPKRTVYRERHPQWGPVIIKRFHAPTWWQRLGDRRRAEREAGVLQAWHNRGLPVPAPARVRRTDAHWELVLPEIPRARSLQEWLQGAEPWPLDERALAQTIGATLAHFDRSGSRQGDPHPGNLLIDEAGRPWLIDPTPSPAFSGRGELTRARWVQMAAQVREHTSAHFRARILHAYRKAQGPAPPVTPGAQRERLEQEARSTRRAEAERRTDRWFRESGATLGEPGAWVAARAASGSLRTTTGLPLERGNSLWRQYARLVEMAVPCVAPARWQFAPPTRLESWLPAGWHPLEGPPEPEAAGRILGVLHDRGLPLASATTWSGFGRDETGTVRVDPELATFDTTQSSPCETPNPHSLWSPFQANAQDWQSFVLGFLAAQQSSRVEQARLRAALEEHGPR